MNQMFLVKPDFIVHYSRGEPFRSITSLSTDLREKTIADLTEKTAWGLNRFSNSEYLVRRLEVERSLRNDFIKRGGQPEIEHPIYFFLGRHSGFEAHPLNKRYEISLKDIPKALITFTYGDTMLSFFDDYRTLSGEKYQNSLCNKIFLMDELGELLSHVEYPKADPLYIEAQLWMKPLSGIVKVPKTESQTIKSI